MKRFNRVLLYITVSFLFITKGYSQTVSANEDETITGRWIFNNVNGAAITVDQRNKPTDGISGGIHVIPSDKRWDSYFGVSHPNYKNRRFTIGPGDAGINSDSWFPAIEARVMSDAPAFYINAQQYGPTNNTHPIIVLDGRKPGGTIPSTQPLLAIANGWNNYKVKFLVDGTIETAGGGSFIGNVGIGTTNPGSKLNVGTKTSNSPSTVAQLGKSQANGEAMVLSLVNSGGGTNQSTSIGFHNGSAWSPTGKIQLIQVGTDTKSKMRFYTYNSGLKNRMTIDENGFIGIGTESPIYKLDVAGTIRATEIKVEAQTADFVFDDDYSLRDLNEVESFINDNKHLPGIPSDTQMEAEGVNLAEMNKLLLMKVEELTLYLIQQQKLIDKLLEAK